MGLAESTGHLIAANLVWINYGRKEMNERIKELAEQAGFELDDELVLESQPIYYITQEEFKKFAELIVKQCGYYADIFESLGCPLDMDPTETKPSDYIKKHFGVEQ
jgi:hypothetical protein